MSRLEQTNDKKEQIMKATISTVLALSVLILALAGFGRDVTAERTIDHKDCGPSSPSHCT